MLPRPRLRPSARSRRRSVPASITSATDGVTQTPHHLADPADSLPSPRGWQPPRTPAIAPDRQWPGCGALPELAQGGAASLNRTAAREMQPSPPTSPSSPRRRPLTPAQPPGRRSTGPRPPLDEVTGRASSSVLSRPRVGRLHAVDRVVCGRGVESTTGAVAVGGGGSCSRRLSPSAGASLLAVAPFPVAARRTGRADFPHPALGRDHAFAHGKLAVRGARCVSP